MTTVPEGQDIMVHSKNVCVQTKAPLTILMTTVPEGQDIMVHSKNLCVQTKAPLTIDDHYTCRPGYHGA